MDREANALGIRTNVRRQRQSGVGTGTISLIVVFTVLCFATLALLSLSTAASSMRIQQRGVQLNQSIALAKGNAAEAVSLLDAALSDVGDAQKTQSDATVDGYLQNAFAAAEDLGWQQSDNATFTQNFAVNEEIMLICEIMIEPLSSQSRYSVVQQTTVPVGGWQQGAGGELWIP